MGQLYDMLYPTKFSKPKISLEYEAVDWAKFIPLVTSVLRHINNTTLTTINNPGALVYLFLGRWSSLARLAQDFSKLLVLINLPYRPTTLSSLFTIANLLDIANHYGSKSELYQNGRIFDLTESQVGNIYYTMFMKYDTVTEKDIEKLKIEFVYFKLLIILIKSKICTKCEERRLKVEEISQMKLFKPIKLEKEITVAMKYYKSKSPELYKLAQEVLTYIQTEIIDYIKENVIIGQSILPR